MVVRRKRLLGLLLVESILCTVVRLFLRLLSISGCGFVWIGLLRYARTDRLVWY